MLVSIAPQGRDTYRLFDADVSINYHSTHKIEKSTTSMCFVRASNTGFEANANALMLVVEQGICHSTCRYLWGIIKYGHKNFEVV
jgi:hypothetical protein